MNKHTVMLKIRFLREELNKKIDEVKEISNDLEKLENMIKDWGIEGDDENGK